MQISSSICKKYVETYFLFDCLKGQPPQVRPSLSGVEETLPPAAAGPARSLVGPGEEGASLRKVLVPMMNSPNELVGTSSIIIIVLVRGGRGGRRCLLLMRPARRAAVPQTRRVAGGRQRPG